MNLADTKKFQILGGILIFIIIVILLYLKNNSYFQSLLMKSVPTPTPTSSANNNDIIIPGNKNDKEALVNKAKNDLSKKLNIDKSQINVIKTESR